MYFLFTNDVETTSLELNRPADFMAEKVKKIGLPRVLDLCSKHDIQSTFFFTADIVQLEPTLVDMVKSGGHEIGCHGLTHDDEYDLMSYNEQLAHLTKAKSIIEKAANQKIVSFRGPEARINENTVKALEAAGFKYDSSVCSQRFDGPLSKGFKKKLSWIIAPRRPYRLSHRSIGSEGDSKILEIPVTAFLFPFIGSTMRVSPGIFRLLKRFIFFEKTDNKAEINFIFHPTEAIELDPSVKPAGPARESFFTGTARANLKHRNLGLKAVQLMDSIITEAKSLGYKFTTVRKYAEAVGG